MNERPRTWPQLGASYLSSSFPFSCAQASESQKKKGHLAFYLFILQRQ